MLAQQLVNGVVLGAVYCLVAVSYSLVMGVLGILNIAVAAMFLLGGYVGLAVLGDGWSVWASLALAIAVAGVGGVLVERVAHRPLHRSPVIMPLLSTLGVLIMVQTTIVNIWGSDPVQVKHAPLSGSLDLGAASVSGTQLLIVGAAVVLCAGLGALIRWTWIGRGIRAVAEDRDVSSLLGVPAARVTMAVFGLSGLLAGAGGLLIGLNYEVLSPGSGIEVGLKGIAVMVVGGARNVWGGLIAGPLLGIAEVLAIAYGDSAYRDMVVWGFLIVVLLLRPEGLLSVNMAVRRA